MKTYTVITGASSGIGQDTARKLVQANHNVIIVARRTEKLNALRQELLNVNPDVDVVVVTQDLAKTAELNDFYQHLNTQFKIDTWINNAGFDHAGSVASLPLTTIQNMINTNVTAVTILTNLFVRDHQNEAAQLVNVASLTGYLIWPGSILYSATKHFVTAFTEGLANELLDQHAQLRVKILSPRATETNFNQVATGQPFDYQHSAMGYNTSEEMAGFMMQLLNSTAIIGYVNDKYQLELLDHKLMADN